MTLAEIVSVFYPLLGDNVVKYRFILRSGVTFMELLAGYGSALTLSFGGHFFNLLYHPMQILPQMELISLVVSGFNLIMSVYFLTFLLFVFLVPFLFSCMYLNNRLSYIDI